MILTLRRDVFTPTTTLSALLVLYEGGLYFNAQRGWVPYDERTTVQARLPFGYACEDEDRGLDASDPASLSRKVRGETAIPIPPSGGYDVRRTPSARFSRSCPDGKMIELLLVPGFRGIRVHPGNTDVDTEGCLLPGTMRDVRKAMVLHSRAAWAWLDARVGECEARNEPVRLTIERDPAAWALAPHNPARIVA